METTLKWAKSPMTWSKEFCIGEQYNSTTQLQKMYASDYALTLHNKK